ncbi:UNVERIFIED_CONTAM: hypothetical protein K2H54_038493 [Gekko kuhli]
MAGGGERRCGWGIARECVLWGMEFALYFSSSTSSGLAFTTLTFWFFFRCSSDTGCGMARGQAGSGFLPERSFEDTEERPVGPSPPEMAVSRGECPVASNSLRVWAPRPLQSHVVLNGSRAKDGMVCQSGVVGVEYPGDEHALDPCQYSQ